MLFSSGGGGGQCKQRTKGNVIPGGGKHNKEENGGWERRTDRGGAGQGVHPDRLGSGRLSEKVTVEQRPQQGHGSTRRMLGAGGTFQSAFLGRAKVLRQECAGGQSAAHRLSSLTCCSGHPRHSPRPWAPRSLAPRLAVQSSGLDCGVQQALGVDCRPQPHPDLQSSRAAQAPLPRRCTEPR